jgi:hypothetical protein
LHDPDTPRPTRRRRQREGADAAFAKSMARSEFGRFYTDEAREREVRASLARSQARRRAKQAKPGLPNQDRAPAVDSAASAPPAAAEAKPKKHVPWRAPRVRELRQQIAEGKARLLQEAKER